MRSQAVTLGRRRVPKCWLRYSYIEIACEDEAFEAITHSSKSYLSSLLERRKQFLSSLRDCTHKLRRYSISIA